MVEQRTGDGRQRQRLRWERLAVHVVKHWHLPQWSHGIKWGMKRRCGLPGARGNRFDGCPPRWRDC
jgi:hypothetical protein